MSFCVLVCCPHPPSCVYDYAEKLCFKTCQPFFFNTYCLVPRTEKRVVTTGDIVTQAPVCCVALTFTPRLHYHLDGQFLFKACNNYLVCHVLCMVVSGGPVCAFVTDISGGPLHHNYQMVQFHSHWGTCSKMGSEHTVDGEHYAGEVDKLCLFHSSSICPLDPMAQTKRLISCNCSGAYRFLLK